MSALRDFAVAFCTVCVMTGGLYLLCPRGALEKAVKYLFSLIFLLCTVSALPGLGTLRADIADSSYETEAYEDMCAAAAQLTFETALRNCGIEFSKITVCTDKNTDGSIQITKVTVATSGSAEEVREALGGDGTVYTIEVVP